MNERVAYALVVAELQRLCKLPYSELMNMVGMPERKQVAGTDGESYYLESAAFWDSIKSKDIRVIVAANDGGWRAFNKMDFIMRPDGSFAGERIGGKEPPPSADDQKIEVLKYELDYRRNKQWNIFSWCSAILVAIVGGTIVLNRDTNHPLQTAQKGIITFAVVVLAAFACLWLSYNAHRETVTVETLEHSTHCELRTKMNANTFREILTGSTLYGYRLALALLAIAALLATWWPVYR